MVKDKISSDLNAYLLMLLTVFLWGLTWPLGRWMVSPNYGTTIPPIMIANVRYMMVVVLFIPIAFYQSKNGLNFDFLKKHWGEIILMGLLSVAIYQAGYLYGELYTAGGDAALVIGTAPIWILFISHFAIKGGETLTKIKILGAAIAFTGVMIVVGNSPNVQIPENERLFGDALVFIGALGYASYTVLLRRLFGKYQNIPKEDSPTSVQIQFWIALIGLSIMYPISLLVYPDWFSLNPYLLIPDRIWFGIIYLALFSTVIGYVTYTEGIKRLGSGRAAIFVNLVPVIGVISSVLIGEVFDPVLHPLAFIMVFIGIYFVNRDKLKSQ